MRVRNWSGASLIWLVAGLGCSPQLMEAPGVGDPGALERRADLVDELCDLLDDAGIVPLDSNPTPSDALFDLGQVLAFDKELSGNRNIGCLTCHHPGTSSDDDRALPLGEGGVGLGADRVGGPTIPRNAPELFNRHLMANMFWDSRVEEDGVGGFLTPAGDQLTPEMEAVFEFGALAAQAMFPVTSREEMRGQPGDNEIADLANDDFTGIWEALMTRLGAFPEYVTMFEAAYPATDFDDMTFAHAANAIAAFEAEGFVSLDSPFQEFLAGDPYALSTAEVKGGIQFFEKGCAECHNGPMLTDLMHHNTGLAQFGPGKGHGLSGTDDEGRVAISGDPADLYAFRTPSLHNVDLTGPWGHVGQFNDLVEFVEHYAEPEDELRDYDITEHVDDVDLHDTVEDNIEAVVANLSPRLLGSDDDDDDDDEDDYDDDDDGEDRFPAKKIVKFLETLTGEAATDLSDLVPESVPSGQPVID